MGLAFSDPIAVPARYLNGDNEVAAVAEEIMGIEGNDAGLVGLGHVGEDDVHHPWGQTPKSAFLTPNLDPKIALFDPKTFPEDPKILKEPKDPQ